jgi:hypothetical protein
MSPLLDVTTETCFSHLPKDLMPSQHPVRCTFTLRCPPTVKLKADATLVPTPTGPGLSPLVPLTHPGEEGSSRVMVPPDCVWPLSTGPSQCHARTCHPSWSIPASCLLPRVGSWGMQAEEARVSLQILAPCPGVPRRAATTSLPPVPTAP